ncbi:uncharacterized protein LOC118145697 isoform X3 [Callithrix jacchus]
MVPLLSWVSASLGPRVKWEAESHIAPKFRHVSPALGLENASTGRPASGATRPARGRKWERQRRRLGPSDEDAPGSEACRPRRSDSAAARPQRKLPPLAGCRPPAAASWPPQTHGAGHRPRPRHLNPFPTGREAPSGAGCASSPQRRSRSAAPSGSLPAPPSAPSRGCHQPRGGQAPTQASSAELANRPLWAEVNDNDVLNGSVPSKELTSMGQIPKPTPHGNQIRGYNQGFS